jgi:hypothetical protein
LKTLSLDTGDINTSRKTIYAEVARFRPDLVPGAAEPAKA